MPAMTKAEKDLEKSQNRDARKRAEEKAKKLQVAEFTAAFAVGAVEGFAETMGLTFLTEGFGPLKLEYIQAGAGLYLAFQKKGDMREVGSAMANIGLYKMGRGIGTGLDLSGFLGD